MQIRSILAVTGVVLLATTGAAQADEVLTATGGSGAEGFSALKGVSAVPLSIHEATTVFGRLILSELLDALILDPDARALVPAGHIPNSQPVGDPPFIE